MSDPVTLKVGLPPGVTALRGGRAQLSRSRHAGDHGCGAHARRQMLAGSERRHTMGRRAITIATAAVAAALWAPAAALGDDAPVTPAGFHVEPAGLEIGVPKTATGFQGPLGSALTPDGDRLISASSGPSRFQAADVFDLTGAYRSDSVAY